MNQEAIVEAIEDARRFGEHPTALRVPAEWVVESLFHGTAAISPSGHLLMHTAAGIYGIIPDSRLVSSVIAVCA